MSRARGLMTVVALLVAAPVQGQAPKALAVRMEQGPARSIPIATDSGYAVVPVGTLADLAWQVERVTGGVALTRQDGPRIDLRAGTPFFQWGAETFQLADAPYVEDGELLVPLQLLTDFLPYRQPATYAFDGPTLTLHISSGPSSPRAAQATVRATVDPVRVVVIDAGHGGEDPGAIGPGGNREKNVALGIAQALAEELRRLPGMEVHLTRDRDVLVPLWERGETATRMKGERAGVFISLHANSFRSGARGFETYFLSEARTEDERRVAAIENAPMRTGGGAIDSGGDLDFILRELRNLDHQHWSALLAEMVQQEVDVVHPGPNRGVKQGPFAVITNALMPSVLVEIGFLSHPEEARLLGQADFQRSAGRAIAKAVSRFFERYPPGAGVGGAQQP